MPVPLLLPLAVFLAGCSSPPPPDVVFLTIDTLRADHVEVFAPDSPARTPGANALAADGVAFTQAFSPISVTAPAFASLLTGANPGKHGLLLNLFRGGEPLSDDVESLAERLQASGYDTAAFVSGYTIRRAVGLNRGFRVYSGGTSGHRYGGETTDAAITWLNHAQGPTFLWYHSYDPHGPVSRWGGAAEQDGDWARVEAHQQHFPLYQKMGDITDPALFRKLYVRGVEYADRQIVRMVEALKKTQRYDNALIVYLADHGEGFDERDLWFDHGTSAHVEQLKIPLVVKYPKSWSAGTRDDRLVSLLDVAPTVLELLELPPLPGSDGVSLKGEGVLHATLVGESSHCKRVDVLPCLPHGGAGKEISVRSLGHTLVRQSLGDHALIRRYDRTGDPAERTPLSTTRIPVDAAIPSEIDVDLAPILDVVRSDRTIRPYPALPALKPRSDPDPEMEKLRALGYVE